MKVDPMTLNENDYNDYIKNNPNEERMFEVIYKGRKIGFVKATKATSLKMAIDLVNSFKCFIGENPTKVDFVLDDSVAYNYRHMLKL